jgi:hypothetical protein
MKIGKSILGITGEYYTAAELGKRNVYAQLTLGNQKRADLLIFSEDNDKLLKIEVKCKQGNEWPACKGIWQKDSFIVFVDFKNIDERQRPDFYILSEKDWRELVVEKEEYYKKRFPNLKTEIKRNVLITLNQLNKQGKPYLGCGIIAKDIVFYRERWDKILGELGKSILP